MPMTSYLLLQAKIRSGTFCPCMPLDPSIEVCIIKFGGLTSTDTCLVTGKGTTSNHGNGRRELPVATNRY